jgi:xanthine dehydrogenase YagS FAD-binding subunit
MNPCSYSRTNDAKQAIRTVTSDASAAFLAGGTTLIDLMKENVMRPSRLVDINELPWDRIEPTHEGGLRIGAMVRNSELAHDARVKQQYPVLSEALLSGASAQLRNMATTGGNLLQRTRCPYFRDTATACNKRQPGSGCGSIPGYNRSNAVLGTSSHCIASHPSDMCVAMAALDAVLHLEGPNGERQVNINDFYLLPGATPQHENVLQHGELIKAVVLPPLAWASNSHYLKVRDRASYEFALVSVAAALDLSGGHIRGARVALGGVATRPWRSHDAEKTLVGHSPSEALFRQAAEAAFHGAVPYHDNAFKIEMGKRALVRALSQLAGIGGPQA